jgi:hypothetical protein
VLFYVVAAAVAGDLEDSVIALAVMILLELIIAGEGADIDLMWIVVIGVSATSYAIRYNSERVWWRDLERKAKMITGSREGG